MTDPILVMERLDGHSMELDRLSKALAQTERELGGYVDGNGEKILGIEQEWESFRDDFECGMWDRHVKDDAKFPSEAMRLRLARREARPDLLGRYTTLLAKRKRLEKRIGSLKAGIDAQRSILSALKMEAEAAGAGLRRAA